MKRSGTIVSLERFWAASGDAYEATREGWLAEPSSGTFHSINSRITATRNLAHTRCLILLGEPGMGKTSALNEGQGVQPDPSVPLRHFDLGAFSSEERLVSRVFEDAELTAWTKESGELCLSLDGFDEAYNRIETLPRLLVDFLNQRDCSGLYLRVACRTANWPAFLREKLEEVFGEDSVRVQELLPLRRADAAVLLRAAGVDPVSVLASVEAARVVPLAARPLTLNLLRASIDPAGGFPQSASELYDKGLLALADEMNPMRRGTGFAAGSAVERITVASRIAAISIFGGRPSVWIGHIAEADDAMITVDECLPADFVGQAHATSSEVVDATLRTGLFTGNGKSRLGWAHATFADFLAVKWMLSSSLDDQQIESLLFAEDGQIYPRVQQVAAWLVAMAPTRFRSFITRDPQAFLQNVDIPEESLRAALVDALFSVARAGAFYDEFNFDLTGLSHAGLAAQVRQALKDPSDDVRRLALRTARQCRLIELFPDITAVALDVEAEVGLRVTAALDVHDLSTKRPSSALVGLLKPSGTTREASPIHHELEGAALMASWPHAITTAEVFAMLGPRYPRNFLGMYSMFVSRFAAELTDSDLVPACNWILSNPEWLNDSRFATLTDAIILLCINHLDDPLSQKTLRHAAFQRAKEYRPLFSDSASNPAPELNDDQRHAITLVLLAEATEEQTWAMSEYFSNHGLRLLSEADFEWLIEQYRVADGIPRTNIATALHYTYRPDFAAHNDVVLGLPDTDPAAEVFGSWRAAVRLDSPEAAQARAQWAKRTDRQRKREEERTAAETKDAEVNSEIAELAQRALCGDVEAYWHAVRLVTVRPGTQRFMDEFQPDLTEHPRWETLLAATQNDLVASSIGYLENGKCKPESWLAKDITFYPAQAGYRALMLLLRERPTELADLPPATWREWAPIIIAWTVTFNGAKPEDKTTLIGLAAKYARPEMVSTLLTLVERDVADQNHVFATTELAALMSDDLADELALQLDKATGKKTRDSLLNVLIEGGWIGLIESVLLGWMDHEERSRDPDRAADAAMTLLQHAPKAGWPRLRALLESDSEFVKKAILANRFAYDHRVPDLDEASLGDLYLRVRELFPPAEDPQFEDAHWIGPREALAEWRDKLLEALRRKGTYSAVQAIQEVCEALPDEPWLKRVLIDAKRILRDQSWQPLSPQELDQLASSQSARLVRTDADLQSAVLLALEAIQTRLQSDTPSAPFLWDTHSGRPKAEEEISDYLAIQLSSRLGQAGAVVNREVQVRRIKPSGLPERADLRFEAIPSDAAPQATASVKIPGEVKGSWNAGVIRSVSSQLVDRYMADFHTEYGIYIVVWFDQESWADSSDRRRSAAAHFAGIDDLRAQLENAAAAAGGKVAVVVLNASIRRVT